MRRFIILAVSALLMLPLVSDQADARRGVAAALAVVVFAEVAVFSGSVAAASARLPLAAVAFALLESAVDVGLAPVSVDRDGARQAVQVWAADGPAFQDRWRTGGRPGLRALDGRRSSRLGLFAVGWGLACGGGHRLCSGGQLFDQCGERGSADGHFSTPCASGMKARTLRLLAGTVELGRGVADAGDGAGPRPFSARIPAHEKARNCASGWAKVAQIDDIKRHALTFRRSIV